MKPLINKALGGGVHVTGTSENSPQDLSLGNGLGRISADSEALHNVKRVATQPGLSSSNSLNEGAFKNYFAVPEATLPFDFGFKKDQAGKSQESRGAALQQSGMTLESPVMDSVPHTHVEIKPAMPFDTTTAYKIVEELEDWKEKQQEIFLSEVCDR